MCVNSNRSCNTFLGCLLYCFLFSLEIFKFPLSQRWVFTVHCSMLTTQELKPPSHIQAIIHSIFFALGLALAPFSSQLFCYMEWLHLIVCCVHSKPEPISKRSAPHQNIMWNHNNNCNHLLMFLEIDLIWFDWFHAVCAC